LINLYIISCDSANKQKEKRPIMQKRNQLSVNIRINQNTMAK